MTRRERLERKLEKRETWAKSAQAKGERRLEAVRTLADSIPLGQPILVGHHSERPARRDAERIQNGMRAGVDALAKAQHHAAKADGLAAQLDHSVFSDDDDAIEKLQARIAENEATRDQRKRINTLFRKGDATGLAAMGLDVEKIRAWMPHYEKVPFPSYSLTNIGARIRSDKKRIEEIEAQRARSDRAESAGGVLVVASGEYTVVTFAEKPDRDVLTALRDAGYRWGAGSWVGLTANLPGDLVPEKEEGD